MEALHACGVDTDVLLGQIDVHGRVRWHELPHSEFDGVGGLGHLLRQLGHADLVTLPRPRTDAPPGALGLLRAGIRFTEWPLGRAVSLRMERATTAAVPRQVAWSLLDEGETCRLIGRARAAGVSVNAWLLFTLTRALQPLLDQPEKPCRWMIPVNMRGAVRHPRDTANHVGYVRVGVSSLHSARDVHDAIHARIAASEHWWLWYSYRYGSLVGSHLRRMLARADLTFSKPYLGCFSNLGVWRLSGPGGWVVCPPVAPTMPVGAGCVTYAGRMGVALRFHSLGSNRREITEDVLQRWLEGARG
jgi:hypothetical protein